mmetsp:Transcript_59323/g.81544  ORF Transcript_59323/g.81544 Transcript_59323/m.81544 type:complete len:114 (-) Transcript_59323:442-783(-)
MHGGQRSLTLSAPLAVTIAAVAVAAPAAPSVPAAAAAITSAAIASFGPPASSITAVTASAAHTLAPAATAAFLLLSSVHCQLLLVHPASNRRSVLRVLHRLSIPQVSEQHHHQ